MVDKRIQFWELMIKNQVIIIIQLYKLFNSMYQIHSGNKVILSHCPAGSTAGEVFAFDNLQEVSRLTRMIINIFLFSTAI